MIEVFNDPRFNFIENRHTYTYDGRFMPSVTGVCKRFKKPFDKEGISAKVAAREGKTPQQVQEEWSAKGKVAADLGTEVHKLIEQYWTAGGADIEFASDEAKRRFVAFLKFRRDHLPTIKPIAAELKVFSVKMWLAGTIDLLAENDKGDIYIFDWKTNGRFGIDRDGFDLLMPPFNHLMDNELNNYSIQLTLYRMILADHGINTRNAYLVWLPPNGANAVMHKALELKPPL